MVADPQFAGEFPKQLNVKTHYKGREGERDRGKDRKKMEKEEAKLKSAILFAR